MSGEHRVTKALFDGDSVTVHGFAWCKEKPVTIGLASATAKILCTKHNSDLSEVDIVGTNAFRSLQEMFRMSVLRSERKGHQWSMLRYFADGPKLERWFLKTLINLALAIDPHPPIGRDSDKVGPSRRLVEIAFGLRRFEGEAGLYTVSHIGQPLTAEVAVRFAPLIANDSVIVVGLFLFGGVRIVLALDPQGVPPLPIKAPFPGGDWNRNELIFHLRKMSYSGDGKRVSQIFEFRWD